MAWPSTAPLDRQWRSRRRAHEVLAAYYAAMPQRDPAADRIAAAMLAFAAGDALGVPWEGSPPGNIPAERIRLVPAPDRGWPRGATSDDTAQMLLVSQLLADSDGRPTAEQFMARLAAVIDEIRGIGPSTSQSIEHYRRTGTLPDAGSSSVRPTAPPCGCRPSAG